VKDKTITASETNDDERKKGASFVGRRRAGKEIFEYYADVRDYCGSMYGWPLGRTSSPVRDSINMHIPHSVCACHVWLWYK
jgi:hypothetical protein